MAPISAESEYSGLKKVLEMALVATTSPLAAPFTVGQGPLTRGPPALGQLIRSRLKPPALKPLA